MAVLLVPIVFATFILPCTQGVFRYSADSCADLYPRQLPEHQQASLEMYQPETPSWRSKSGRSKRSQGYGTNKQLPFKVSVREKRYKRNTDVTVQIEGHGFYEALMVQGRAVSQGGDLIPGGVGLIGRFSPNYLSGTNFTHQECFRQPFATVVDSGHSPLLGNVSFVWTAPDADSGSIQFLASLAKGQIYNIFASNILHFNPYPISTVQCGGIEACFRVCPLYSYSPCDADDVILIYAYNVDLYGKREVEFTLGGTLDVNRSYLAVVLAEDNDNLVQADVTVCYVEHGKVKIAHLQLEVVGQPLYPHPEEIALDDYDIDTERKMLWCRYRRLLSRSSVINPFRSYYTLLYKGDLDLQQFHRFITPTRASMYSSDMKFNLTTPVNKIYAGGLRVFHFASNVLVITSLLGLSAYAIVL